MAAVDKPRLNFWQIWNMSFGFMGIQFGWGLQMANMSGIYEFLGAKPDEIPILWLAAPLTGLIVQPIIGQMSDRTWGPLGRRRPYFLTGAILSSIALVLMPNSSTLWMAAGLLWVLDACINISMEPFRAFVADMLPEDQRVSGFTMQSFFIGIGQTLANLLPWLFANVLAVSAVSSSGPAIPASVRYSFYAGAFAFLTAVLWTVFTTKEYPPQDLHQPQHQPAAQSGSMVGDILSALRDMPATMKQLAAVQFATWMGLFCMWLFFTPAIARTVFGATDASSPQYREALEWGGNCFAMYSVVCFLVSRLLPRLAAAIGRRYTHAVCLLAGAAALLAIGLIDSKWVLLGSMVGVGIAWASILSMPYAILAGAIPEGRTGIYMGIFNFSIVLPEILAALSLGAIMRNVLGNNPLYAVLMGGVFLLIAAMLMQFVREPKPAPGLAPIPTGAGD